MIGMVIAALVATFLIVSHFPQFWKIIGSIIYFIFNHVIRYLMVVGILFGILCSRQFKDLVGWNVPSKLKELNDYKEGTENRPISNDHNGRRQGPSSR